MVKTSGEKAANRSGLKRANHRDELLLPLKQKISHPAKETPTMILTKSQGERLTTVLHAARPEWSMPSITKILQTANANEGLPGVDFDHALRALIAYATARNPDGTYAKQTPGFIHERSRFWETTAPADAPPPKLPPCKDHEGQDAETCACCWADIKLGQRPESMLGKRLTPTNQKLPLPPEQVARQALQARQAIRNTKDDEEQNHPHTSQKTHTGAKQSV